MKRALRRLAARTATNAKRAGMPLWQWLAMSHDERRALKDAASRRARKLTPIPPKGGRR